MTNIGLDPKSPYYISPDARELLDNTNIAMAKVDFERSVAKLIGSPDTKIDADAVIKGLTGSTLTLPGNNQSYTIKEGDTLIGIAKQFRDVSSRDIENAPKLNKFLDDMVVLNAGLVKEYFCQDKITVDAVHDIYSIPDTAHKSGSSLGEFQFLDD
jgi:hypothetical protein